MFIDWKRVAKPQPDLYDLDVILDLVKKKTTWEPRLVEPPSFCDGKVMLRHSPTKRAPWLSDVSLDDPRILTVEALLKMWPEGYNSFTRHCDVFFPLDMDPPLIKSPRGSCSGHDWDNIARDGMSLYVTIFDPQGCAEGIAHELGHLRLRCLGIQLEDHDGNLILNGPTELFVSPVRKDTLRPMSAVLHGEYAWVMLSELDLRIGANLPDESAQYLKVNIPKVEEGLQEIKQNAKTTSAGEAFLAGFCQWTESVIERGHALLASVGVQPEYSVETKQPPRPT